MEYRVLITPVGRPLVVICSGALLLMEMLRPAVALCAVGVSESTTFTVKFEVPVAVGVPVIWPLLFRPNPAGRLPLMMLHVYGCTPPVAPSVALYA